MDETVTSAHVTTFYSTVSLTVHVNLAKVVKQIIIITSSSKSVTLLVISLMDHTWAVGCVDMNHGDGPRLLDDSVPNCSDLTTSATTNATTEEVHPAEYYAPIYRVAGSLLVGVIFVVGLVGNALVIAVVTRTRSMHTPTNWYLVSLALADIILLVSAPLPTLVEYHLLVDEWVFGRVGCSAMVFMQYLGVNLSSLSITAFTIER